MVQVNTYPRLFYPCAEYAARGHGYVPAHSSAWIPRVTPHSALKDMLFCMGPRSRRLRAVCLARYQFSLNRPRESPCTGKPMEPKGESRRVADSLMLENRKEG